MPFASVRIWPPKNAQVVDGEALDEVIVVVLDVTVMGIPIITVPNTEPVYGMIVTVVVTA